MNALVAADRMPGPASLRDVSMSARRRWKERAEDLLDKNLYRPRTLERVSSQLDALSDEDVGLGLPPAETGQFTLYEVKKGDALRKIAKEHLGSADRATEIYALNRDKLEDMDRIYVGQMLRLPGKPTDHPAGA
jgi:nucleoid-associated protein YgaU